VRGCSGRRSRGDGEGRAEDQHRAAPDEVFNYVSDVRNDPSWHTDVLQVTSSTDAVEMGTVFDVKVKPSMGVSGGTMTVSKLKPGRLIEFRGRMGRMSPIVTNICEPDGPGTLVTRRVEMELPGVMRLMASMVQSKVGKSNEGFLANLKRLLERSGV
jgi:Polyketide cyclase / dehydrase and lipid transport